MCMSFFVCYQPVACTLLIWLSNSVGVRDMPHYHASIVIVKFDDLVGHASTSFLLSGWKLALLTFFYNGNWS